MAEAGLTAYWIRSPFPHAPPWVGVTARSRDNALGIIHAFDYGRWPRTRTP